MTDERDRRRTPHRDHAGRAATPPAGTRVVDVDDTLDDGVVVGEVNPDHTPVEDVVARITAIVGELDSDTRGQLADAIGSHDKRGKQRAANKILSALGPRPPVEVDASAFEPDPRWATFDEMQAEFKICREDRLKREKWKHYIFGGKLISGASLFALLVWIGSSLETRALANVEQRRRIEMLKEHETVLRDLSSWRRVVDFALGLRATGGPP